MWQAYSYIFGEKLSFKDLITVGTFPPAEIAKAEMHQDAARLSKMRDRLEKAFQDNLEEIYVNGSRQSRMPHVTNISFKHVEGEGLMMTFQYAARVTIWQFVKKLLQ